MNVRSVKYVNSDSLFHKELNAAGIRLVIVYFSSNWCGPCESFDPEFQKLPSKYPSAVFIKVDVDKCVETIAELEISVVPTFIFYRNKVKINRMKGAFLEALEERIKQNIHLGESENIQDLVDFERRELGSSQMRH